jgi:hypothetical protein
MAGAGAPPGGAASCALAMKEKRTLRNVPVMAYFMKSCPLKKAAV